MTIIEKILGSSDIGSIVNKDVDLLMGHDGTAVLAIDNFNNITIWDKSKLIIVFDHFCPPSSVERANIQNKLIAFVKEHGIEYKLYEGICHQLLIEDKRVVPGRIIVGADSHTVSSGALGCLATGVGSTDFLEVMKTGKCWFIVPDSYKVVFKGKMPPFIQGKDLILEAIRQIKEDGAIYKSIEYYDETNDGIKFDDRITISNMSVEMGAKAGIFVPDEITKTYVKSKGGDYDPVFADSDARYSREILIDVGSLTPLIAVPNSLHIKQVKDVIGTPITQAYVGSCTSGRIEDFMIAAKLFSEHKVHEFVKTIVSPASNKVLLKAIEMDLLTPLINSGITVLNTGCGPCCNIDKGLVGDNEICISSTNRNFLGRMGSFKSKVFLASTYTVCYSATKGKISDIRELY